MGSNPCIKNENEMKMEKIRIQNSSLGGSNLCRHFRSGYNFSEFIFFKFISRYNFSKIRSRSNFFKFWSRPNFSKFRSRSTSFKFKSRCNFSEFRPRSRSIIFKFASDIYLFFWCSVQSGFNLALQPHASNKSLKLKISLLETWCYWFVSLINFQIIWYIFR